MSVDVQFTLWNPSKTQDELNLLRKRNNPEGEPVGPFTGRCKYCHSSDLWDDNLAYGCNGCNGCGALLGSN